MNVRRTSPLAASRFRTSAKAVRWLPYEDVQNELGRFLLEFGLQDPHKGYRSLFEVGQGQTVDILFRHCHFAILCCCKRKWLVDSSSRSTPVCCKIPL